MSIMSRKPPSAPNTGQLLSAPNHQFICYSSAPAIVVSPCPPLGNQLLLDASVVATPLTVPLNLFNLG